MFAAARKAVAAVLDAWAEGRPAGASAATRPDVYVVDKHRRPGQRLARYDILGELSHDKARDFAVRLRLENPDERPVVRFLVVGIDPLWVFREEDYAMITHWMHPMEGPSDRTSGRWSRRSGTATSASRAGRRMT